MARKSRTKTRGFRSRSRRQESAKSLVVKRSPKSQLEHLDTLLGVGVGAKRERARLMKKLEEK